MEQVAFLVRKQVRGTVVLFQAVLYPARPNNVHAAILDETGCLDDLLVRNVDHVFARAL